MQKRRTILILTAAFFLLSACAFGGSKVEPTATPVPPPTTEPTPIPSPTPIDLTVVLSSHESEIHDNEMMMDIFLTQPVMEQPESKAATFNQTIETLVQTEINSFTDIVTENLDFQAENAQTFGYNSMHLEYAPTNTGRGIVSIHFTVSTYVMGAAHPFSYSSTLNYDLAQERTLQLEELFLPGSDYLGVLSTQCIQIISETGYMDWPEGAAPKPDNYRNWNITPDGILISFDPYQIAPYAVGPQQALRTLRCPAAHGRPRRPTGSVPAMTSNDPQVRFTRSSRLKDIELRFSQYREHAFNKHFHRTYSIGVVNGGQTAYFHHGITEIIQRGDIALINANEVHACNPVEGHALTYYMLYIQPDLVRDIAVELTESQGKPPHFPTPVVQDPPLHTKLVDLCQLIGRCTEHETVLL